MPKVKYCLTEAQRAVEAQKVRQKAFRVALVSGLEEKELSREELAEKAEVGTSSLYKWKRDMAPMTVKNFGAIARVLGWSPETVYKILCG